jgi:hypothetical protein
VWGPRPGWGGQRGEAHLELCEWRAGPSTAGSSERHSGRTTRARHTVPLALSPCRQAVEIGRRQGEGHSLPAAPAIAPSPPHAPTPLPLPAPLFVACLASPHAPTGRLARGFEAARRGRGEVGGGLLGIAATAEPRAAAADGTAR